jgi:hypothetical protein
MGNLLNIQPPYPPSPDRRIEDVPPSIEAGLNQAPRGSHIPLDFAPAKNNGQMGVAAEPVQMTANLTRLPRFGIATQPSNYGPRINPPTKLPRNASDPSNTGPFEASTLRK